MAMMESSLFDLDLFDADETLLLPPAADVAPVYDDQGLIVEMDDAHPGYIVALNAMTMDQTVCGSESSADGLFKPAEGKEGTATDADSTTLSAAVKVDSSDCSRPSPIVAESSDAKVKRDASSLMGPAIQQLPAKKQKVKSVPWKKQCAKQTPRTDLPVKRGIKIDLPDSVFKSPTSITPSSSPRHAKSISWVDQQLNEAKKSNSNATEGSGASTSSPQTPSLTIVSSTNSTTTFKPIPSAALSSLVSAGKSAPRPDHSCSSSLVTISSDAAEDQSKWKISPTTGVKIAESEDAFKDFAQSSVQSLIQSAQNKVKSNPAKVRSSSKERAVDISAGRIKALTTNWIAALDGSSGMSTIKVDGDLAGKTNLSASQRAKLLRDRNRDHARNTRMRKKAYVEELKTTLVELITRRDLAALDRERDAKVKQEQREVRFRVLEEYLKLAGSGEDDLSRWMILLDDEFVHTQPKFAANQGNQTVEHSPDMVLKGAKAASEGSAEFLSGVASAADSLEASTSSSTPPIGISYKICRDQFLMDGAMVFIDFSAVTVGLASLGARGEVSIKGSVQAQYNAESNKLTSVTMTFDTGMIRSQIDKLVEAETVASSAFEFLDDLKPLFSHPQVSDASCSTESVGESSSVSSALWRGEKSII